MHDNAQSLAGFNPDLALLALRKRDKLDRLLERRAICTSMLYGVVGQVELNIRSWWIELAAAELQQKPKPMSAAELRNYVKKSIFNFATRNCTELAP